MRENERRQPGTPPPAGTEDRRTFERHQYRQDVEVVWMDPEGHSVQRIVHHCRAVDLSRGGLRLVDKRMQYPGTLGVVLLRTADGSASIYGVRVRNSVYAGGLMYATGCEFVPIHERLRRMVRVENGAITLSNRVEDIS
jgi:hypothetical protein